MSDYFFYMHDGIEHGPFSNAAIKSLLESGKLAEALVRTNSDSLWRLPEESGLTVGTQVAQTCISQEPASATSTLSDPAAVQFRTRPATRKTTADGIDVFSLAGFGGMLFVAWLCYAHLDSLKARLNSAIDWHPLKAINADWGATTVIKSQLVSPSSYQQVSSEVFWSGQTNKGHDAYIVKVIFDSQNAFGASLRNCQIASFTVDGDTAKWSPVMGLRKCDINLPADLQGKEKSYYASKDAIDFLQKSD